MFPPRMEMVSPARSVFRYSRSLRSKKMTESPSRRGSPVVRRPWNVVEAEMASSLGSGQAAAAFDFAETCQMVTSTARSSMGVAPRFTQVQPRKWMNAPEDRDPMATTV